MKGIATDRAERLRRLTPEQRALLLRTLRDDAVQQAGADAVPRRAAGDPAPASFAQQRLWLLDQLTPGSPAYNLPYAARLSGRLAPALLRAALAEVVRRHEVLRTAVVAGVDGPVQAAAPAVATPLPLVDLGALAAPARAAESRRLVRADARRPFDLARSPLLRAALLRLAAESHLLLICLHHIVSDGWSDEVLMREVAALYAAGLAGAPSPLAALPVQYADFALWQRRQLTDERLAEPLAYWRRQLQGAPPVLELPTDFPRAQARRQLGGVATLPLPSGPEGDLERTLAELARSWQATPFTVWLALFQALLGRWSGERDVVVGSPVASRERPELEGLIGFFANTLVLRVDLGGDPSLAELVARARRVTLEAQEHAAVPFERLIEELRPERVETANPLFQVAFVVRDARPQPVTLPGVTLAAVSPAELHGGVAKFDLTLFVERGAEARLWLEHNRELFAPTTAARLLRQLQTLASAAAARPDAPLSTLAWLTPAERHQTTVEWRESLSTSPLTSPQPSSTTVPELIAKWVAATPDAVAVTGGDGEVAVSYRELAARAAFLTRTLRAAGVAPGSTVGVAVDRSPELVIALTAVLATGGAYLAVDPAAPAERRELMLADAGVRVVLGEAQHLAALAAADGARTLLPVAAPRRPAEAASADRASVHSGPSGPSPEDLAYVAFTSGSTGRPKGVAVPHRAVVRLVREPGYVHLGADEVVLHLAPVAFDASTLEIWGPLANGGRLAVMPAGTPSLAELGAALVRRRVTTLWLTAGLFHQMVDAEAAAFRNVRQLLAGGDVLSAPHCRRLLAAAPGCRLIDGYGPTENTTFTCCHPMASAESVRSPVPIGRPIPGTRVHVLDRSLSPVAIGTPGELCAGGAGVARGYVGHPAATAARFVPEPHRGVDAGEWGSRMYRTGDRARYLADGTLDFLGRGDQQVKVRGFRIELEEIESALAAHPEVRRAAVAALPAVHGDAVHGDTVHGDKVLVAFVVARDAAPAAAGNGFGGRLRDALRRRLPEHMVPGRWHTVAELPLNVNGKVDRAALARSLAAAEGSTPQGDLHRPPRTPVEEIVAGVWAEVLGVDAVGVDDDFFALGGHSLLATRIMARLRELFGVDIPLATLFDRPTVAALAQEVEARRDAAADDVAPLVPAARHDRLPLSYAQERLWVLDRFEPGTPAYNITASVQLRGDFVPPAFDRALAAVIDRHEILRTVFEAVDGAPGQRVLPRLELAVPRVELRRLDEPERRRQVERWGRAVAATSFDLARGPLLRIVLLRTAPAETVLLLAIHHVVSDGWSIGLLVSELAETYAALLGGRSPALPPLPVQYADFAVWQRGQKAMLERQVAYWRRQLAGAPPGLELPTDHPRPGVRTFRGASAALRLDAEQANRVRALARRHGATLFMALLAAFKVLLQRLSGESDVVVGAPIAGRGVSACEGVMGIFLNTLVLRTDLAGSPPFIELLARVRQTALGGYAHQDVPFEKLLDELRPERDLSRTPLFQVFFNMLNFPAPRLELPGLEIETLAPPTTPAKFDLTVYAEEKGEEITFDLVYNTDLFGAPRMAELLRQYRALLEQVTAAPERPIDALSLVTAEARAVLPDPRQGLSDAWLGAVQHIFARRARRHPERPAVAAGDLVWSYAELEARANRLARRLRDGKVEVGGVVAIHARRDPRLVWAVIGVMKAGAAFVILDPTHPADRLLDCLRLARPQGWIEIEPASPELLEGLATLGVRCRVALPPAAIAEDPFAGYPDSDPEVAVGPLDLAYIAFTSGSTGTPKGILGRHGPLSHFIPWQQEALDLRESDRYSMLSGLSHDPLQRDMFTPLQTGGVICVPEPQVLTTPGRLAAWMHSAEVTVAHLTPAMGQVLTEGAGSGTVVLDRLRRAFFVGDILTRLDVERLRQLAPDVGCVNFYGSTETQRAVGYAKTTHVGTPSNGGASVQGIEAKEALPLGRGVADVQLLVLGRRGGLAGVGEVGEIYVRSPHLARGYLGDPAGTAARFVPHAQAVAPGERAYRTGDLGRYLPDGAAEFAGRADFQLKIRGFRIEPGEIQALLARHPAVRDSVVVARDGAAAEKRLVAYVAATGGPDLGAELRELVRERLPAYMVPAAVVVLDRLPLNPNGKIDRRALPAPSDEQRPAETAYVAPRTEAERRIAGVLRELLGVDQIGRKDSIFELGGDSLLAVRVQSRLREIFGRDIRLVELFTHPTVASLADWLGEGSSTTAGRHEVDRSDELRQGKDRRRRRFEKMQERRGGAKD